jgi:N-acetylglucosaminyl-diphospho-decaprenol L-rhamnosyltransferase
MAKVHVAVSIVGYRNADDIVRCLAALGHSQYNTYEVIICENGGAKAYQELIVALPSVLPDGQSVRVVQAESNLGYGGGVNACLREVPGADAWWILNPDTEPYPLAMSLQVKKIIEGNYDAVGCTIHLPNDKIQSHGGNWNPWLGRAVSIGHSSSMSDIVDADYVEKTQNYLNGASMMITRRFLDVVGYMREDYFLYCEEVEWCLRGKQRGMKLGYTPDALVKHYQGTTTGSAAKIIDRTQMSVYLNARNQILLTRDRFPSKLPVTVICAVFVLLLKYARRGAWKQFGYAMRGWAAGLGNQRGQPCWLAS